MSLFKIRNISTVLNPFEAIPSIAWYNLTGVPKHTFYLHLKETGFRFNHRHNDLYKVLLKMFREDPLK